MADSSCSLPLSLGGIEAAARHRVGAGVRTAYLLLVSWAACGVVVLEVDELKVVLEVDELEVLEVDELEVLEVDELKVLEVDELKVLEVDELKVLDVDELKVVLDDDELDVLRWMMVALHCGWDTCAVV
eukprot:6492680-Amphidinium_carterae.3